MAVRLLQIGFFQLCYGYAKRGAVGLKAVQEVCRQFAEAIRMRKLTTQFIEESDAWRHTAAILTAKELAEERKLSPGDLRRELGVRDFVVPKLVEQARQFSFAALERAHRLVLETEQACKTGTPDPRLALELLVLEICARRAA